jgi:integrase
VDKYIQRAINKRSLVGAEVYRHSLAMFEESAKDIAYIDEVTEDTLLTYHAFLRKRGNSERTISNRHGHVKSLLLWSGVDQKIVGKGPKYDKKLVVVYSRDEMDTLFAACDDPYFLTVLKILQMAGLREAEATHLTWGEVDLKKRLIHVKSKPEYGFSLKDREERVVPLPPALVAALQERRKVVPKSKLVVGTDDDKPHTKWLRFLKRLAKAAGLNCGHCRTCRETDGEECQRWTLHSFRRSYATTLDERRVSLKQIMDFLGHADIETTMKYLGNRGIKDSQAVIDGIDWSGDPARDRGDVCPTCGQSVEVGRPRP